MTVRVSGCNDAAEDPAVALLCFVAAQDLSHRNLQAVAKKNAKPCDISGRLTKNQSSTVASAPTAAQIPTGANVATINKDRSTISNWRADGLANSAPCADLPA